MNQRQTDPRLAIRCGVCCALLFAVLSGRASAQLFENLDAFGKRLDVGDPAVESRWRNHEGPKGIASSDFNGDGRPDIATSNLDGTVTVFLHEHGGRFSDPTHLRANVQTLRGIVAADFNGDGFPDLATAAPLEGQVVFFLNDGGASFRDPNLLRTWEFGRDLGVGDFDGDGIVDLVVGGSTRGVSQHRGQGDGSFGPATFVSGARCRKRDAARVLPEGFPRSRRDQRPTVRDARLERRRVGPGYR